MFSTGFTHLIFLKPVRAGWVYYRYEAHFTVGNKSELFSILGNPVSLTPAFEPVECSTKYTVKIDGARLGCFAGTFKGWKNRLKLFSADIDGVLMPHLSNYEEERRL